MPREKFERQAHGAVMIDGVEVAHTLQCPHCGGHFVSYEGSGERRAHCPRCDATTCGNPACDPCIPVDAKFDHLEGKLTNYTGEIMLLLQKGIPVSLIGPIPK